MCRQQLVAGAADCLFWQLGPPTQSLVAGGHLPRLHYPAAVSQWLHAAALVRVTRTTVARLGPRQAAIDLPEQC
jgi:hypothetical protein